MIHVFQVPCQSMYMWERDAYLEREVRGMLPSDREFVRMIRKEYDARASLYDVTVETREKAAMVTVIVHVVGRTGVEAVRKVERIDHDDAESMLDLARSMLPAGTVVKGGNYRWETSSTVRIAVEVERPAAARTDAPVPFIIEMSLVEDTVHRYALDDGSDMSLNKLTKIVCARHPGRSLEVLRIVRAHWDIGQRTYDLHLAVIEQEAVTPPASFPMTMRVSSKSLHRVHMEGKSILARLTEILKEREPQRKLEAVRLVESREDRWTETFDLDIDVVEHGGSVDRKPEEPDDECPRRIVM